MSVTQLRPCTLGGSTAAAACGVDPYRSRVALWSEMTGRIAARIETEPMTWGKRLEPVIMAALWQQGCDVEPGGGVEYVDEARPWLVGHPDGFTVDEPRSVVEVKTASSFMRWDGSAPLAYAAQCQAYMHLTGLDRALLAVLIGGQRLETLDIRRDDHAIRLLLDGMTEFMGYVERDECPPPDGSDSTREALLAMYPHHDPEVRVRLNSHLMGKLETLKARKAQRDVLDGQIVRLENELKLAIGEAEVAVAPNDDEVIHWRDVTSNRTDVKRLRADHPEIAAEYVKVTETRRFTLL